LRILTYLKKKHTTCTGAAGGRARKNIFAVPRAGDDETDKQKIIETLIKIKITGSGADSSAKFFRARPPAAPVHILYF